MKGWLIAAAAALGTTVILADDLGSALLGGLVGATTASVAWTQSKKEKTPR
jgi:uncharacterized protein YhfF